MNPNIKDAIVAAFTADALSLGVHWVYDISEIEAKYGRLTSMVKPELALYHKPKQKGEFTHYGDQMMVLLESVTESSGFNLIHFSSTWQKMFQSYDGYMDHATKETMQNFNSGKKPDESGSLSLDLSGASRIAPLALYYGEDVIGFIDAARAQTAMTHHQMKVSACAELFARVSVMVLKGINPIDAFDKALNEMRDAAEIQQMVKAGLESRSDNTREAIGKFGQECSVQAALPSTIHLIAKYEDNLREALIENIMAGGDSSARGMLAGFILGCWQGLETLPGQWLDDMAAYEKIVRLMH
jgi:ADP-ribosylglycohydrolase